MATDLNFIGKNIRCLRRQRGWTMAKLAAKIGIREGPLGKIERGANAPSAAVIYRTAKVFGVSVDAIFKEETQMQPCRMHENAREPFQVIIDPALPELPQKTYIMASEIITAVQALEDICHAQKRAAIPLYLPFDPTEAGMETLSADVRRMMGIKHAVIFDYFELFENTGFRVIVAPLPKELESFCFYDPSNQNAFFFLNTKKNPERQLFQLAYDLGSVFICTCTRHQGRDPFAEPVPAENREDKPFTAHRAARRFSATFLMPAQTVRDTAAQLGIRQKKWSYELLLRIKHRFGVSAEAFLYRLNELNLIDPDLVEPLYENIASHYKKTGFAEPDLSRRLLTPNGRLWDLVLTAKQFENDREEVSEIEKTLNKWKVVRK